MEKGFTVIVCGGGRETSQVFSVIYHALNIAEVFSVLFCLCLESFYQKKSIISKNLGRILQGFKQIW